MTPDGDFERETRLSGRLNKRLRRASEIALGSSPDWKRSLSSFHHYLPSSSCL